MRRWLVPCSMLVFVVMAHHETSAQSGRDYRIVSPPGGQELQRQFSSEQIEILEVLNRADVAHLQRIEALVIPESWTDLDAYSPFPREYAWGTSHPQLLVVHQPSQSFAAYEHGRRVHWGPVSTGRERTPTPAGLFHLNWRSRGRYSTVNASWFLPWYFNFENFRGLSFHEYALPGRPASHACVRLLERDARWVFDWGHGWTLDEKGRSVLSQGTPVLILGCFDFRAPLPWRSPSWLASGITLPDSPAVAQTECP